MFGTVPSPKETRPGGLDGATGGPCMARWPECGQSWIVLLVVLFAQALAPPSSLPTSITVMRLPWELKIRKI